MDAPSFHGPALKVIRAEHHICDLNRRVAEFFNQEPRPCTFVSFNDYKAQQAVVRFEQYKPVPTEFGLIIGDAIHNLRSSLDLAMSEILVPRGVDPEKIQFPFSKRADTLESTIVNRLVQVAGPKIVTAIRNLKPYPGGNDDLYGLHELDIADKHRILIPILSASSLEGINVPGLETHSWAYQELSRVAFVGLKDKAELWRVPYTFKANRQLRRATRAFKAEQDIGGSFHIAFAQGLPFEKNPVIPVLVKLRRSVDTALSELRRAFDEG
jgi:hypothetical protein